MPTAITDKLLISKHSDPFGMLLVGRNWEEGSEYRYGFNEQETDCEIYGSHNSYNFEFRVYDARLNKFFSVDPLTRKYPFWTPYAFAGNTPIQAIDLEGAETFFTQYLENTGDDLIRVQARQDINKTPTLAVAMIIGGGLSLGFTVAPALTTAYLGEEIWEEAAGHPIVPDPGDLFQRKAKDVLLPDPNLNKVVSTDPLDIKIQKRSKLSSEFYRKYGYTGNRFEDHAKFIDLNKDVYTQSVGENCDIKELVQYRIKSEAGTKGAYYAPFGTKPEEIGIDPNDVAEIYKVTVNKNTKVLFSTHVEGAELYYAPGSGRTSKGGGTQIFSPEIEKNSTFTLITK